MTMALWILRPMTKILNLSLPISCNFPGDAASRTSLHHARLACLAHAKESSGSGCHLVSGFVRVPVIARWAWLQVEVGARATAAQHQSQHSFVRHCVPSVISARDFTKYSCLRPEGDKQTLDHGLRNVINETEAVHRAENRIFRAHLPMVIIVII